MNTSPQLPCSPAPPLTPPTYPARPVNGGPLDKALPKSGRWFWEPKFNGWRALVHRPTGAMFNRHGQRLTIEKEFSTALELLRDARLLESADTEWLDCEALDRRHGIGCGALIVLDVLNEHPYERRRMPLEFAFAPFQKMNTRMPNDTVWFSPAYPQKNREEFEAEHQEHHLWDVLQQCNADLGCQFYEGLLAKRADSIYPRQLHSADKEFPYWMKHRWAW